MFIAEILAAFVIALLLSFLLAVVFGWEYPGRPGVWPSLLFVFFIIFLATWAFGAWIPPAGPAVWGVYWLPFIGIGLIFMLLIAALIPPLRGRRRRTAREEEAAEEAGTALGVFFWVFMLFLIISIIGHYAF